MASWFETFGFAELLTMRVDVALEFMRLHRRAD